MQPPAPDEFERLRRRRNYVLLAVFGAIALLLGLIPTMCMSSGQPQGYWKTYASAPRSGEDALPALVPPSATEIHTRHDDRSGLRWVRFTFAKADHDAVTRGLRRLSQPEAKALPVKAPGFSPWWTVNERTMLGRAGDRLEAYELPGKRAWLIVDPASDSGFYWSEGE